MKNHTHIHVDRRAPSAHDLNVITHAFKKGDVVMLPSDTCYGLSCIITDKQAVEKIFHIKGRQPTQSISVAVADLDMFRRYGITTPLVEKFIRDYLPGPVTLIVHATQNVPVYCRAPDGTIGMRIIADTLTEKIIRALDTPILTTSANITGKPPAYSVEEFLAQAHDKSIMPDLIVDAGVLERKAPSTVLKFDNDTVHVIRAGSFILPHEFLTQKH